METLLEQAKKIEIGRNSKKLIIDEEIELALAWLKGEITTKQVSSITNPKKITSNALYRVALVIKESYKRGIIKL